MQVDLSDGQSAQMIPVGEIRHRKIMAWKKFIGSLLDGIDDEDYEAKAEADEQYYGHVIAGLVTSWTLVDENGKPLPVTADNVLDLLAVDVAALKAAADPALRLVSGRPVDPKSRRNSGG